ncbi:hypothetical protein B9Z55_021557 [Caenorhabditis nigoni]|uniref:DUF38 domain-containing protein n=1 Tax=Caenorhabditis nigoni TaxID=1611254 RepID=A0A2G5TSI1_9PELO|nr:hypothetical protein B9Z55_021557 [Caenorhabditis nigoni]
MFLKEMFLFSPTPKSYRIGFNRFEDRNNLHLSLGISEMGNKWFFKIDNSGEGVLISLFGYSIIFERVPGMKF